jgi:hypothetical protein
MSTPYVITDLTEPFSPVFLSPLPNPQLWNGSTIGFLQAWESFANGGWWHDPNILSATGKGIEVEEPRAWNGWWNEQIVWPPVFSCDLTCYPWLTILTVALGQIEHGSKRCTYRALNGSG